MEKLKALRAGNRATITKTIKKMKEILSSENTVENETETIVENLYGNLLKKKTTVEKLNEEILLEIEPDFTEQEVIQQDEYELELTLR